MGAWRMVSRVEAEPDEGVAFEEGHQALVPQIRNPKTENRRKAENRNPNPAQALTPYLTDGPAYPSVAIPDRYRTTTGPLPGHLHKTT